MKTLSEKSVISIFGVVLGLLLVSCLALPADGAEQRRELAICMSYAIAGGITPAEAVKQCKGVI